MLKQFQLCVYPEVERGYEIELLGRKKKFVIKSIRVYKVVTSCPMLINTRKYFRLYKIFPLPGIPMPVEMLVKTSASRKSLVNYPDLPVNKDLS